MPYAQFKQVWQDAEPIGRLLIATSRMMDWLRVVVPAPAAFLIGSGGVGGPMSTGWVGSLARAMCCLVSLRGRLVTINWLEEKADEYDSIMHWATL